MVTGRPGNWLIQWVLNAARCIASRNVLAAPCTNTSKSFPASGRIRCPQLRPDAAEIHHLKLRDRPGAGIGVTHIVHAAGAERDALRAG